MRRLVFFALLLACSRKSAMPIGLYCEGGVVNGKGDGGECINITADGKATLQSKSMTPFTMQRDAASKNRFVLVNAGFPSGTLQVDDGDWLTVTIDGRVYKMRSDAPGAFI